MAHLLVLGGSGIISTKIVALALQNGHRVTMVNRGRRKTHVAPQADCIVADLRNEPMNELYAKIQGNFDVVLDFISYTPQELMRNMSIAKNRCLQYIFVSSATVYNQKEGRYTEDDPIGDKQWDYAVNKTACEALLVAHAADYGFDYTIIRPYVTYGETRIPYQFAPLDYYTLIARMQHGKCIPILDEDVYCTLTNANDFAVAANGLILLSEAFGQVFHITGAYETTWKQALLHVSDAFAVRCDMVCLSRSLFYDSRLMRGLNTLEVTDDKGNDMLFDNSKIKKAVPAFTGTITLQESLPKIVAYFENTTSARLVDYAWDGCCDHMLAASKALTKAQKKKLKYYPQENKNLKDFIVYTVNRYSTLFYLVKAIKKAVSLWKQLLYRSMLK